MYFWCFGFRGELGFLNCDDVCMCVVNKQFELLEFVSAYRVFCNILKEKTEQHIPITTKQEKNIRTFCGNFRTPLTHTERDESGGSRPVLSTAQTDTKDHIESKEPTSKERDSWDLYTKSNNPVDYAIFAQLRNQLRGLTQRLRACFEHNIAQDLKPN